MRVEILTVGKNLCCEHFERLDGKLLRLSRYVDVRSSTRPDWLPCYSSCPYLIKAMISGVSRNKENNEIQQRNLLTLKTKGFKALDEVNRKSHDKGN